MAQAPHPSPGDLELARAETVRILRRMADLIEQSDGGRWPVTLAEIRRLRARAGTLSAELARSRERNKV